MKALGYAYPWDVLGDPLFASRVLETGLREVVLAASYHSARAATPYHPAHQLVEARHAALYRPVRSSVWSGRLTPLEPDWVSEPDAFGVAAAQLTSAGLRVSAWVVLTHNSRLGSLAPDVAVRNCFGDLYPYALCPSHAEVRAYAATLAAEAVRDVDLAGVSLEACGQLGLTHLSHHEKTDGAWSPLAQQLLSVCCCSGCAQAWRSRGLDPDDVTDALRRGVQTLRDGGPPPGAGTPQAHHSGGPDAQQSSTPEARQPSSGPSPEDILGTDLATALLEVRHASADSLRHEVLQGISLAVTLHGHPDPWATGASPGLTVAAGKDVAGVLVPCWPTGPASADAIAATRRLVPDDVTVGAYVTVLPPANPDELGAHVERLAAAGTGELHLYHLGLAGPDRRPLLRQLATAG